MDPYRDWLEIATTQRPPSHYELLNVQPFESDPVRLQDAYSAQMAKAMRYKMGAHMDVAQRLFAELSDAFVCLTDPRKKDAYDAFLRAGETLNGEVLSTVATSPPIGPAPAASQAPPATNQSSVSSPPPRVLAPKPVPVTGGKAVTSEKVSLSETYRASAKRRQSPQLAAAAGAAALVAILIIVWLAGSSSPPREVPTPAPVPGGISKQTPPAAPPQAQVNREAGFSKLLADKPAAGTSAHFFALLLNVSGEVVHVVPRVGTPKVAVVFPGAIEPDLTRYRYQAGDLLEIRGVVEVNEDPDVALRISGEVIQKADAPATRIAASQLSPSPAPAKVTTNPPGPTTPATPAPSTTAASTPAVAPSEPYPGAAPPKPRPASPKPRPSSPMAAPPRLPDDWDQRVAASETLWKRVARAQSSARHVLAGEFAALEEVDPPVVHLRFGATEALLRGPFTAEGLAFLRELDEQDAVELEIRVDASKPSGERASLVWMALAGAPQSERIAFRPPPPTTPLATILLPGLQRINGLAWSPDGGRLLVASAPALVVDAATGREVQRFSDDECKQAQFSGDGDFVALHYDRLSNPPAQAGGGPGLIVTGGTQLYEADSAKLLLSLPTNDYGNALFSFNPKRQVLAAIHDTGTPPFFSGIKRISQFNLVAGKQAPQLVEDFYGTARLAWKHDGSQLAWAITGNKNVVRLMRVGAKGGPTNVPLNGQVNDLAWVPNSNLLAVCGYNGLQVGDMTNMQKFKIVLTLAGVTSIKQFSFSHDGRWAAVEVNREIQVRSLDDAAAAQWSQQPSNSWQAFAWSPTASVLAALDSNGTVSMWDEQGLKLTNLKSGFTTYTASSLAWSPSGHRLAVFGSTNSIALFDTSAL